MVLAKTIILQNACTQPLLNLIGGEKRKSNNNFVRFCTTNRSPESCSPAATLTFVNRLHSTSLFNTCLLLLRCLITAGMHVTRQHRCYTRCQPMHFTHQHRYYTRFQPNDVTRQQMQIHYIICPSRLYCCQNYPREEGAITLSCLLLYHCLFPWPAFANSALEIVGLG